MQAVLFVCEESAIWLADTLRAHVIPALLSLQHAGIKLVRAPSWSDQGERIVNLLRSQGIPLDPFQTGDAFDAAASVAVGESAAAFGWSHALGIELMPGDWLRVRDELLGRVSQRRAHVVRKTRETAVDVVVDLDRAAVPQVTTGIGFFDHMLEQLGTHAGLTLSITVVGDLAVDEHHTVEDTALALGDALRRALGRKHGIQRYGFTLPMDEALAEAAIDLCGRAVTRFEGKFPRDQVGGLAVEMVPHFCKSLADSLGASLHVRVRGDNAHHMVEAVFKVLGRCLRQAVARDGSMVLPSTKGIL